MGGVRPFPRRPAVREVVGSEKVGFGRIIENIVAGVDAGVKMRVDEAWRDKAAPGVDLLVHRLRILLAGEIDSIPFEDHDAVFEYLMLRAVKADDETALDDSFHGSSFPTCSFPFGPIRGNAQRRAGDHTRA